MSDYYDEGLYESYNGNNVSGSDWANFGQSFAGLYQVYRADQLQQEATEGQVSQIRYAGQVASQGAMMSAAGYRKQAALVPRILSFNLAVDNLNTQRALEAEGRQFHRLLGTQISQIAASGVSLTSGSSLQVRNETIDTFANKMLQTRVDAENRRRTQVFEANMHQFQLEEQASVEDYNAQLAQWNAEVQAVNARNASQARSYQSQQSLMSGVPTLFSELFQE
jgi:hypothetical protein